MNKDLQLENDIRGALTWVPSLRSERIVVTSKECVITLTGTVDSVEKKMEVEKTAKAVPGVTAVMNGVEIRCDSQVTKADHEIVLELQKHVGANWDIPDHKITASVENGWITLRGDLEWAYQKDAAQAATRHIKGVTGVSNEITIRALMIDKAAKMEIEKALVLSSAIDDREIHVAVASHIVSLEGIVSSVYEKEQAGRIAQNTPGVLRVENGLVIEEGNG
jgi:osmotically-inducible protein OsmY